jgi:hypothetical protein
MNIATYWDSAGKPTNLQKLLGSGWNDTYAYYINNAGDIEGNRFYNGVNAAFLLLSEPVAGSDKPHWVNASPIEHAHSSIVAKGV